MCDTRSYVLNSSSYRLKVKRKKKRNAWSIFNLIYCKLNNENDLAWIDSIFMDIMQVMIMKERMQLKFKFKLKLKFCVNLFIIETLRIR